MTEFLIVNSTDAAKTKEKPKVFTAKYPWRTLTSGQSFIIPTDVPVKFKTIEDSCYKWSKKLKKKFRAVDHGEHGIEVALLSENEE